MYKYPDYDTELGGYINANKPLHRLHALAISCHERCNAIMYCLRSCELLDATRDHRRGVPTAPREEHQEQEEEADAAGR